MSRCLSEGLCLACACDCVALLLCHFVEMKAVARSQTYQACEPMADDGLTGCNYTCEQQVIAQRLSMGERGAHGTGSTPTSSRDTLCIRLIRKTKQTALQSSAHIAQQPSVLSSHQKTFDCSLAQNSREQTKRSLLIFNKHLS